MSVKKRRAGELYRKTASRLIPNLYPELSEKEYEDLLDASYEELEDQLGVEKYLLAVAEAIDNEINNSWTSLPGDIEDIILYSNDVDFRLKDTRRDLDLARPTNGEKGEIVVEAARAVHDIWVEEHSECFFDKNNADKLYTFMPLELVGYDQIALYREIFIEPLLFAIHLSVDSTYVERAYDRSQYLFLFSENVRDKKSLCRVIEDLDYGVLPEKVRDTLRWDHRLVSRIATQIIRENPVLKGE